jgi:hypothetical protein
MATLPRFFIHLPHARRSLRARSVAFAGFRAGGLISFFVSSSSRSPTGATIRCFFRTYRSAVTHAQRTARRSGWPIAIERDPVHGWCSAAPVANRHSRMPTGCGRIQSVAGGLRGLILALDGSGIGVMD